LNGRGKAVLLAGLLLFSGWSVYTRYVDLHAFDLVTNMSFRDLSMSQYDDTLAGVRKFPYQWRVLAFWMVRAGTMVAPIDPHLIDAAIKTLALAASAALLYAFSLTLTSALGAVLAAVMYLFVTAAAFGSEGYAIYFTNDYLAILSFFAGVVALRRGRWWLAALAVFAGAWAKENRDARRVPRRLRSAAQARTVVGGNRLRRRIRHSHAHPPDDVSRAARAVGLVGHLQDERAVHRVGPGRDREIAARQPEGVAVFQRDALLGLAARGAARRIRSSSRWPSRSPATSSWPGWWCISENYATCCPSQSS
jgi:hypothetical protein